MTVPPEWIKKTVPINKIRATHDSENNHDTSGGKDLFIKIGIKKWPLYITKTEDEYYLAENQEHILEIMKQLGWEEVLCYVYIGTR